jgi:hypothetical protein
VFCGKGRIRVRKLVVLLVVNAGQQEAVTTLSFSAMNDRDGRFVLGVGVMRPFFDFIFRCQHRKITFPRTQTIQSGGSEVETYVVCLDCGKRFAYDWENMHLGKPVDISSGSQDFAR